MRLKSRTPGGGALELAGSGDAAEKGANVIRVKKWQTAVTQVDLEWSDDRPYECFRCGAIWHPIESLQQISNFLSRLSSPLKGRIFTNAIQTT